MISVSDHIKVYIAFGHTDMRKSINGLAIIVEDQLDLDLFSGHLFAFCNGRRNILKILYWDRNGFCLWQKRLEKDRFKWPCTGDEVMKVNRKELEWLLDGLEIKDAHRKLYYTSLF